MEKNEQVKMELDAKEDLTMHTPGPWVYDTEALHSPHPAAILSETAGAVICQFHSGNPPMPADARLIAAAPALLAALDEIAEWLENGGADHGEDVRRIMAESARAAIAAAKKFEQLNRAAA